MEDFLVQGYGVPNAETTGGGQVTHTPVKALNTYREKKNSKMRLTDPEADNYSFD